MSLIKHAKTYIANKKIFSRQNVFISSIDERKFLTHRGQEKGIDSIASKPIAIKDNICTIDFPTTAASNILKGFVSPYDATVVKLLRDEGAVIVGKTNMDEFGMGSHNINSHFGPVTLQRYEGEARSAGGSSGGSALAVATSQCYTALGTDTGGSVRLPAAYTGVVGFKPSYGLLSRWGVIAYANSLDTIGILARSSRSAEDLFDLLNVHDVHDPTSLPPATREKIGSKKKFPESLRIGIPLDYNIETLHPEVRNAWLRGLQTLAKQGHTLHPVQLPATQHALPAYYILAPAEASSNLAKYDGVRFGSRAHGVDGTPESVLFAKTRGEGFGLEVQRRILLGAFTLSAEAIDNYFIQAQKVRRLVQQDFDKVFAKPNPLTSDGASPANEDGVDVLFCPTAPSLAPLISEVEHQDPIQTYMNDVFTVPASLAGLPAISVPVGLTDKERVTRHGSQKLHDSAGMQFIGQYGDDKLVLHAARSFQKIFKPIQDAGGIQMPSWGRIPLSNLRLQQRKQYINFAQENGVSVVEAHKVFPKARDLVRQSRANAKGGLQRVLSKETVANNAKLADMTPQEYLDKFSGLPNSVVAESEFINKLKTRRNQQAKLDEKLKKEGWDKEKREKKAIANGNMKNDTAAKAVSVKQAMTKVKGIQENQSRRGFPVQEHENSKEVNKLRIKTHDTSKIRFVSHEFGPKIRSIWTGEKKDA